MWYFRLLASFFVSLYLLNVFFVFCFGSHWRAVFLEEDEYLLSLAVNSDAKVCVIGYKFNITIYLAVSFI